MEKLDFPNRMTLELTNNCNVSCIFCNRQKIQMEMGYMEEDLFYKIIDEMAMHRPIKLVPFLRGEPLMHPKFIEFIKYAKERGIGPIQIASNALLLNEEMQDKLIGTGLDFISFSLDTLDNEIYACSRQLGDLSISMKNVESFCVKCKKRRENGESAPTVQVSTINYKDYIPGQKAFIEHWLKYADIVRVYEQHDENGKLVDPDVRRKVDIFTSRKPCRKVFTDMIVYWDGNVALCNYDWDEKRGLGNLNEMTIRDIWNSEKYCQIRDKHLSNSFGDEICKDCHHWKIDYTDKGFIGTSYEAK